MTVRPMLLCAAALIHLLAACSNAAPAAADAPVAAPARLDLRIGGVRFRPNDIVGASHEIDFSGEPIVILTLTPSGRTKFRRAQRDRLGQALEIRVDGALVSSPVLREPIVGSQVQISGGLDRQEAERLAARLSPRQDTR